MSATIIIDKSQYRNFSCKIGRKNKVTKVIGNQYVIDAATSTTYDEGAQDCAPNDISGTTTYEKKSTDGSGWTPLSWASGEKYYLRAERFTRTVSYEFVVTGKTITNINNMYADYKLYYKTYTKNQKLVNSSNYDNAASSNVFSAIRDDANRPSSAYDSETGTYSDYDGSTTTCITIPTAIARWDDSGSSIIEYIDPFHAKNCDCKVTYVGKTKNADGVNYNYTFRVDLTFVLSAGANHAFIGTIQGDVNYQENYFNEVVKVEITVGGYTVSKEEVRAEYSKTGDESKVLELETNELIQDCASDVTIADGQSLVSFNDIADEIITAYKDNRLIATFDLVNNKKYTIDGVTRLLRAGDKIKIRDLDDKLLSSSSATDDDVGNDFEIIKANTKYSGFYYREIVAKEILNSN